MRRLISSTLVVMLVAVSGPVSAESRTVTLSVSGMT